jgi:hypothetical protein
MTSQRANRPGVPGEPGVSGEPGLPGAGWRKSSFSGGNGGQCVEVARQLPGRPGVVAVRDSRSPDGPKLIVAASDWTAFLRRVSAAARP